MLYNLATKSAVGMVARNIVRIMKKPNGINPIYSEDLYVFRKILNVSIDLFLKSVGICVYCLEEKFKTYGCLFF